MPRGEMSTEELRAIKESVNKEGTQMEEGEEGGAAVYVGTKEEVTKARQLAETEGRAPDLESYIVMHKRELATNDEIKEADQIEDSQKKFFHDADAGSMKFYGSTGKDYFLLFFKDGNGNLAKIQIYPDKIADFPRPIPDNFTKLKSLLLDVGFKINRSFDNIDFLGLEHFIRANRLRKQKEEKGFGF